MPYSSFTIPLSNRLLTQNRAGEEALILELSNCARQQLPAARPDLIDRMIAFHTMLLYNK